MAWATAAQTLLLVVVAFCVAGLSQRSGANPGAALAAGLFVLAYPPLAAYAGYLWPEVLHLAFFLGALVVVLRWPEAWTTAVAAGLLLGLALLTKSLLTPFVPILLAPLLLAPGDWRARGGRFALALVVIGGILAPTVIRNYRATGIATVADSSLFNLWVGLRDRSPKSLVDPVVWTELVAYRDSSAEESERREILRHRIAELLAERGVWGTLRGQVPKQYLRLFDKDSYLTSFLPTGALSLEGAGYRSTPAPIASALRGTSWALYAVLLVLAAVGVWLAPPGETRQWAVARWILILFLLYNLALFLGLHVKSRFRIQMLPALVVFASLGWDVLRTRPAVASWRWGAAAATAAVLLTLAFIGPWLVTAGG